MRHLFGNFGKIKIDVDCPRRYRVHLSARCVACLVVVVVVVSWRQLCSRTCLVERVCVCVVT